ncbi:MAG TPA: class I SAM-dependent methyltransferase [Planctomycetota bacterium]|jgi:2-polyprenyl-3-methyl-5-hydroxy-6-metoxy-1,4-benzoquinol methylase|nr:class I SAM-dependent methyltransferase [Planctomycetota bacterium]
MEAAVYREFLELEQTHWWFRGRRAIFVSLLDRFVRSDGREARVLMDLGCGVGGMLQPLAAYGRVIGTDVTLQGLRYCAERKFPLLVACNGPQGCFLDASLDCITAFDALEHIEDDELALREIFRMLKPGGTLIASGPAYQFLYAQQDRITHHVRRYTLGELAGKARAAGFEIVQASYINFWLFPVILPTVLLLKAWQAVRPRDDSGAGSNVGIRVPRWAHDLLTAVFSSEAAVLRHASMPAGHSLIIVARKPGQPG